MFCGCVVCCIDVYVILKHRPCSMPGSLLSLLSSGPTVAGALLSDAFSLATRSLAALEPPRAVTPVTPKNPQSSYH
jgi:hypothetical protein